MKTLTKEMQEAITPEIGLSLLEEGNKRFLSNLKFNRNLLLQANETSDGQHPFAIILSCIDSRTSVELVFDQGLGDIFSVRIAGIVINDDVIASLEFACQIAGAKIIVVLGHSRCGAVKGACDHVEMGHLTRLLDKIQPAIDDEKLIIDNRNSSNDEFVEKVTMIHTRKTVQAILDQSPVLRDLIGSGKCGIVGGHHDISTGKVSFFKDTQFGFFKEASSSSKEKEKPTVLHAKL